MPAASAGSSPSCAVRSRGVLGLLVCLWLGACGPDRETPQRPNLLLISLDSTRQDFLGCYGCRPKHAPELSPSPNLDRLAARGVTFANAYAPTSWTLPSHMSLFTGRAPLEHAVELDGMQLAPEVPTLARILRRAGYRTGGFVSGPYLAPDYGFGRGFERYELCYGPELARHLRARAETQARDALEPNKPISDVERAARGAARVKTGDLHRLDVSSEAVTDAALAELRAATETDAPWFLFAHYFDPHYDYVAPSPFDRRFDPDYEGPIDGRHVLDDPRISVEDLEHAGQRIRTADARDLEHLLALYQGEIAWVDSQVGRLLDELETLGLAANTLVVITADHGDEFFEHDGLGHRRTLDEEVLRVPLLVAWPGVLPAGSRAEGLVSNCDVLPTVLELFDLAVPPGISGASFAALARGVDAGADRSVGARIVAVRQGRVPLGPEPPPEARNHYVLESFRFGSVKLTREREWLTGLPDAPAPIERLRWLDLASSPGERPLDQQADFADPRARAALVRFRAQYEQQLAGRTQSLFGEAGAEQGSALAALGYTDAEHPPIQLDADRLRTPPPAGPDAQSTADDLER